MKTRSIIFITTVCLTLIGLLMGHFLINESYHGYLYIVGLAVLIYSIVYMLFGLSRFIVYFIYGLAVTIILIFVRQYHFLWIVLFTIIIVLNPLSFFEVYLDKKLSKEQTAIYRFIPGGRYETFYKYRRAMKEHFHFPQVQKLYTKPSYQYVRSFSVIALFSLLVFLLIFSASDIILVEGLDFINLITVYLSLVLTIAIGVLYRSGFTSMFRVFKILTPPIILYILFNFLSLSPIIIGVVMIVVFLGMVGILITEILFYYSRVSYNAYLYTDPLGNEKVYANALFEPFIYEEDKRKSYLVTISTTEESFNKRFEQILMFANYYKSIITAYIIKDETIDLYIEVYHDRKQEKLFKRIDGLFTKDVVKKPIVDGNYYEAKFYHNQEYIITRALSLAEMLKELKINEPVIISLLMYFKSKEQAKPIMSSYNTKIIEQKEDYILIQAVIKVPNTEFLIESSLRNLLLEMLVLGGTFVRVMVYY